MDDLKYFVRVQGGLLVTRLLSYLGIKASTRLTILVTFNRLLDSAAGDLIALALAPSLYLYTQTASFIEGIGQTVGEIIRWVNDNVLPNWSWLIEWVYAFARFWVDRVTYIRQALTVEIGRVNILWLYLDNLFNDPAGWLWNHLPDWLRDAVTWVIQTRGAIERLLQSGQAELSEFVNDPFGYVMQYAPRFIRDLFLTIENKLDALNWLLNEGVHDMLAFLNDPRGAIMAWLENEVLDWLTERINQAW